MEPLFVGRKDLAEHVLALVDAKDSAVLAVTGVHGIGKTSFLERVAALGAQRRGVVSPEPRDMATVAVRYAGFEPNAAEASADALWQTFEHSRMFMTRMAELTGDRRGFAEFRRLADVQSSDVKVAIAGNDVDASQSQFENVQFTTNVYFDDQAVKERIRASQAQLDHAFLEAWQAWGANHTMLLTVDHFEVVAGSRLGDWLVDMVLKLPRLVTVLACTPAARATFTEPGPVQVHQLTAFTRDEVGDYMRRRFDPQPIDDQMVEVTHRFTDGHPGGVKLVAGMLSELPPSEVNAVELRRILDRLPDEPWAQWAELVDLILGSVGSDLTDAVRACAVANTFDEPLLAHLVGAGEDGTTTIITQLQGLDLIRRSTDEAGTAQFRVRDFIRRALVRKLRDIDNRRWAELHRQAAAHYFDRLTSIEDGMVDGYAGWYRYERPDWQHAKSEWLYHSSSLPDAGELTRARFVLVFLEAFYFWGCYQPFEFNRTLLWEWHRADDPFDESPREPSSTVPEEDAQLREALTFLLDHYPPGYVKVSDRWGELRARLKRIERLCGLGRGGRLRDPDGDRAKALLRVFMAHTQRYQVPPAPGADADYRAALEAFVAQDDGWMEAWLQYERADLAIDEGRSDAAVEALRSSGTRLGALVADGDDWDEELLANLCRASGDVLWACHQTDEAMAFYGRAVLHAYRFQGIPHSPDEYTQRFYDEITSRVQDRLRELVAHEQVQDAVAAVERLSAVFTPSLTRDVLARLDPADAATVLVIFPAGPKDGELGSEASDFMDRWGLFDDTAPDSDPDLEAVLELTLSPT